MLYVSDIIFNNESIDFYKTMGGMPRDMRIVVTDYLTGKSEVFVGDAVRETPIDCIGMCVAGPFCTFVKYTSQAAKFMQYITPTSCKVTAHRSFRYNFRTKEMTMKKDKPLNISTLDIYCIKMNFIDNHHSIVSVSIGGRDTLITLYDFCKLLCKLMGFSVMAFYRVCLFDDPNEEGSVVAFKHTEESDRFFTKMAVLG